MPRWGERRLPDLLPGEYVLWQGSPSWPSVARHVFLVPYVACYFTALTLADMWIVRTSEGPGWSVVAGATPTVVSGIACVLLLLALAWAVGRTTTYALTTHRIIMLFGLALPATLSIPLHRIAATSARMRRGTGDIALTLKAAAPGNGSSPGVTKLWPHVRPWRVFPAQPMLRDLSGAGTLAPLLCRALAASNTAPGTLAPLPPVHSPVDAPRHVVAAIH